MDYIFDRLKELAYVFVILFILFALYLYSYNNGSGKVSFENNVFTKSAEAGIYTGKYATESTGYVIKGLGDFIVGVLKAISEPLNTLLKFVLFLLFFVGVTMYVLYFLGVIKKLPDMSFKSMDGRSMKYGNTDISMDSSSYSTGGIFDAIIGWFDNLGKRIRGGFYSMMGEIVVPTVGEYSKRGELKSGRCSDIEFVTMGNKCISNRKEKDIKFRLNGRSEDYRLLPDEFKNKEKELITIPFKEVDGMYVPHCNDSYYKNKENKTGLLMNTSDISCVYVDMDVQKYE